MDFLGIGFGEIVVILILALIVFGPGKVVEIGKTLGKTYRAFKNASSGFTAQITREIEAEKEQPPKTQSGGGNPAQPGSQSVE